jgi:hypothetical protein
MHDTSKRTTLVLGLTVVILAALTAVAMVGLPH